MRKLNWLMLVMILSCNVWANPWAEPPLNIVRQYERFNVVDMPHDGNCLFWALKVGDRIADQRHLDLHDSQGYRNPDRYRKKIAELLDQGKYAEQFNAVLASDDNPYTSKEDYIKAIRGNLWGGELEILIMSDILQKNILVHDYGKKVLSYPHNKPYEKSIHILYDGTSHYQLLAPVEFNPKHG